jgi:hypothetical protein
MDMGGPGKRRVANYMSPTVMAIGSEDTQLRLTQILIIFGFHLSVGFNLNHQQLPWRALNTAMPMHNR